MLKACSPYDGSVVAEVPLLSLDDVHATFKRAKAAQAGWAATSLADRVALVLKFVEHMELNAEAIGRELAQQMGRPAHQAKGEIAGLAERARAMCELAPKALADIEVEQSAQFTKFIRRVPTGVVFCVSPWNYPYLTSVNTVVPALLAGNAVVLKSSSRTPLVGVRYAEALQAAGLPTDVFSAVALARADTLEACKSPVVGHIAFTGSVDGGRQVQSAVASGGKFPSVGLELGGKDPAYVRADVPNVAEAAAQLVDGAMYNSGQSCCGIERIYVHESVFDEFCQAARAAAEQYVLGDPLDGTTNMGPVISASAAKFIQGQVDAAVAKGARPLVDTGRWSAVLGDQRTGAGFVAPQILVDVDHSMELMTEETFGPVVGVMKVASDDEAIRLMNDSVYGLTASVFTADVDGAGRRICDQLNTGTCFTNRMDYLDPYLAWTGVGDTGRGITLSVLGFDELTRAKSYHLKKAPAK